MSLFVNPSTSTAAIHQENVRSAGGNTQISSINFSTHAFQIFKISCNG
jgi:hypothetical protein